MIDFPLPASLYNRGKIPVYFRMTNLQLLAQSWRMPPLGATLLLRGWGADGAGDATRNGELNFNSSVPIL